MFIHDVQTHKYTHICTYIATYRHMRINIQNACVHTDISAQTVRHIHHWIISTLDISTNWLIVSLIQRWHPAGPVPDFKPLNDLSPEIQISMVQNPRSAKSEFFFNLYVVCVHGCVHVCVCISIGVHVCVCMCLCVCGNVCVWVWSARLCSWCLCVCPCVSQLLLQLREHLQGRECALARHATSFVDCLSVCMPKRYWCLLFEVDK